MRLDQLEVGAIDVVDVVADIDPPNSWPVGIEVKIAERGDILVVETTTDTVAVQASGPHRAALERLFRGGQVRVVRLADRRGRELRLQVHAFHGVRDLDADIGVDETLLEKARKVNKGLVSIDDVRGWLADQFVLDGEPPRVFASSGRRGFDERSWVLHGRGVQVVITRGDDDILRAARVVRSRARAGAEPIVVLRGAVRFVDASDERQLRLEARASLEAIRQDDASFMQLWKRYGDIEGEQILRRARRIGVLDYADLEVLEDGAVQFRITARPGLDEAFAELSADDEIEVTQDPPQAIVDASLTWVDFLKEHKDAAAGRPPPLSGAYVRRIDGPQGTLTLKPDDVDAFKAPVPGRLHLSLVGDATRLERREKARERIWSTDARLPQLAMLLERRPASVRATRPLELTPSVRRKVFPLHPPTAAQEEAIRVALSTPDIAVVQGPPGTGKTTVIRAIVACLDEHRAATAGGPGQTLISGFQHVAVDNVIGPMLVNDLPPIKLGHKGGAAVLAEVDEAIDGWRLARAARVAERLPAQVEDDRFVDLRRLVDAYLSAPTPPRRTREMLEEVERLVGGFVPSEHSDAVRVAIHELAEEDRAAAPSREVVLLEAAVTALRREPVGWADDGPENVARLLALSGHHPVLSTDERTQLTGMLRGAPEPDALAACGRLRRRVLLRLADRRSAGRGGAAIRAEIARLLVRVREAFDVATRPRRLGPDAATARYLDELRSDPVAVRRAVLAYTPVYAATCQQAAGKAAARAKGDDLAYDSVLVDEAARANPLDLLIPLAQARQRVVLVGDHKQLPHMVDEQILEELAEGGDATARQELDARIAESLFERMYVDLEERERAGDPRRVVTLDEQFRMHPVLGDFVSSQFYDRRVRSPRGAEYFRHGLEGFGSKPAAWIDVPADSGEEDQERSKGRLAEAQAVGALLRPLMTSDPGKKLSFGVITFYSRQVKLIAEELTRLELMESDQAGGFRVAEAFRWLEGREGEHRLQVGTVDAFQGREFDVVFLSIVRCNSLPDATPQDRRSKYGHLVSLNRLCVAMSRQKKLLVVLGDRAMLRAPHAPTSIGALVDFHALCEGSDGLVR